MSDSEKETGKRSSVDPIVMRVERSVIIGWTWFGVGMVRFHVSESSWYTIWMLFLTPKFAVGVHVGGVSRSALRQTTIDDINELGLGYHGPKK